MIRLQYLALNRLKIKPMVHDSSFRRDRLLNQDYMALHENAMIQDQYTCPKTWNFIHGYKLRK